MSFHYCSPHRPNSKRRVLQKGWETLKKTAIAASFAVLAPLLSLYPVIPNMVQPAIASPEEVASVTDEEISGKTFCVSRELIHARPEQVWQVLSDYSNAPRVFPMMKKCQVLEDHGQRKLVRHSVTPSGPFGTFEYIVEIKEQAPTSMEWHRKSGDFREVDGFWKLEPKDGGRNTLVTYSSHVVGGFFTPPMVVRRQVHVDMPQVMACLKHQAESNSEIAAAHSTSSTQ